MAKRGSTLSAKESLIFSYGKSFNGFAARLSDEEVAKLLEMEGVVSVIPNHKLKLHTTRSWDFMGFSKGQLGAPVEGEVIVGLLDTGIWPESDSFSDKDFGPPPSNWKGKCVGRNFTCNNKVIGAQYYNSEDDYDNTEFHSPRDSIGHGSHTASMLHAVTYCAAADILADLDDAIADGVDIISTSIGSDEPLLYLNDPIAIGSFHAMKKGMLTSSLAGNNGPYPTPVTNYASWILTVAANTIDRRFTVKAVLGNGQVYFVSLTL
ncbi:hypothetical protein C1H46_004292 [Malus baccata]|uniref:Inhibitor I9 domain-containing protein n=1 Tax=Malus baccata TaxID=106549 RepID=A0A540NGG3_MALBA|nr:hypothetical protein C1H46_004292 [Malus baccata]